MNYSDIITQLDLAIPNTTKIDYTKIPTNNLWEKIEIFFRNIGLFDKITVDELNILKNNFLSNLKNIYGMKSTRNGVMKSDDFDQNNYVIKNSISSVKKDILSFVIRKVYINGFSGLFPIESELSIDEIAKKEYIFSHEEIEKYLRGLFFITRESEDIGAIHYYGLLDEILTRFLVIPAEKLYQYKNEDLYIKLQYEIRNILRLSESSYHYNSIINGKRNENSNELYGTDTLKFNFEIEKSIKHLADLIELGIKDKISNEKKGEEKAFKDFEKEILSYVEQHGRLPHQGEQMWSITNSLIKAAEKRNKGELLSRRDKKLLEIYDKVQNTLNKDDDNSIVNVESDNLQNEKMELNDVQPSNSQTQDELVTDETLSENFSNLMSKYSEMQELMKRNKQIIQDISETNKKIEELNARKKELNDELEENNRKLGI